MPDYRFIALGTNGETMRGVMEAPDQAAVIAKLRSHGCLPLRAELAKAERLQGLLPASWRMQPGLSANQVMEFIRELSIMLSAGQDLDRALRFLIETATKARMRHVLESVRDIVRNGGSLGDAMSQQPQSFSRLIIGLVRAGEAGGMLAATLDRLATLLERQRSLVNTLRTAMAYPALLVVASIGSVAFLLVEVLPQFTPLFQQSGASLPQSTRLLIATGDLVSNWGGWALLLALLLGLVLRQALQQTPFRKRAEHLLLRLPVLGNLLREVWAARLTRTLGTLLINGVPLTNALQVSREAIGAFIAMDALATALTGARGGAGLAASLQQAHIFPLRTIHLLRLGEETAQLGAMSLRAADIHEDRVRQSVQRLVALLVPAVTIVMGAVVAAIVSSLLLAMLSINDLAG